MMGKREKKYFVPGFDELKQMVETPASKEVTDYERFKTTVIISAVSVFLSLVAAVFSILTFFLK